MTPPAGEKPTIRQAPPLRGRMSCDVAFRTAAGHYLQQVTAQHRDTSEGKAPAIHAMRVALTRLRATIRFFSPMVAGSEQLRLAVELKWLNALLGIVRDLDVALERLANLKAHRAGALDRSWKQERTACQRHLTRALRSLRYRRFIKDISAWIEQGDWSRKTGKTADRRALPAEEYCSRTLTQWRKTLLGKSRELKQVGVRKRHRIRLANKRFSYAIEAAANLVPQDEAADRDAALKLLRKAQRSLGQLNDDERCRALAAALGEGKIAASELLLGLRQKKRLLRKAATAYEELGRLRPLRFGNG